MNEAWGRRDDFLGEVFVIPEELVCRCAQTGQPEQLRLRAQEKSSVTLMAHWEDGVVREGSATHGKRILCLRAVRADGLKDANWIGKNDVFVEAYVAPPGTRDTSASVTRLPEPPRSSTIEPGTMDLPFQLALPVDAPSSIKSINNCWIRYVVVARVCIDWGLDRVFSCYFTVVQPLPSFLFMHPTALTPEIGDEIHPRIPCIPFFCCSVPLPCVHYGDLTFQCQFDRSGAPPGEAVGLFAKVVLDGAFQNAELTVTLHHTVVAIAEYHRNRTDRSYPLGAFPVPSDGKELRLSNEAIVIPSLPPTFLGHMLNYSGLEIADDATRKALAETATQGNCLLSCHPIQWFYQLECSLRVPDPHCGLYHTTRSKIFPFTVTGIPLSVYGAQQQQQTQHQHAETAEGKAGDRGITMTAVPATHQDLAGPDADIMQAVAVDWRANDNFQLASCVLDGPALTTRVSADPEARGELGGEGDPRGTHTGEASHFTPAYFGVNGDGISSTSDGDGVVTFQPAF